MTPGDHHYEPRGRPTKCGSANRPSLRRQRTCWPWMPHQWLDSFRSVKWWPYPLSVSQWSARSLQRLCWVHAGGLSLGHIGSLSHWFDIYFDTCSLCFKSFCHAAHICRTLLSIYLNLAALETKISPRLWIFTSWEGLRWPPAVPGSDAWGGNRLATSASRSDRDAGHPCTGCLEPYIVVACNQPSGRWMAQNCLSLTKMLIARVMRCIRKRRPAVLETLTFHYIYSTGWLMIDIDPSQGSVWSLHNWVEQPPFWNNQLHVSGGIIGDLCSFAAGDELYAPLVAWVHKQKHPTIQPTRNPWRIPWDSMSCRWSNPYQSGRPLEKRAKPLTRRCALECRCDSWRWSIVAVSTSIVELRLKYYELD